MTTDMKIRLAGVVIGTTAFGWMIWLDWKFAVAVFLLMFGDNMVNDRR